MVDKKNKKQFKVHRVKMLQWIAEMSCDRHVIMTAETRQQQQQPHLHGTVKKSDYHWEKRLPEMLIYIQFKQI